MHTISIPDDWPSVLASSTAFQALSKMGDIRHFDSLPGSEEGLIERLKDSRIAINIRASSRFSETVLERCPDLRMVSIWGTGTDNVDLRAGAAAWNYGREYARRIGRFCCGACAGPDARGGVPAFRSGSGRPGRAMAAWSQPGTLRQNSRDRRIGRDRTETSGDRKGIGMHVIAWTIDPYRAWDLNWSRWTNC